MDEFEVEITPVHDDRDDRDDRDAVAVEANGGAPTPDQLPGSPLKHLPAWYVTHRRLVTSLGAGALLFALLAVLVARLPSFSSGESGADLPPRLILPTATRDPDDRVFYALGTAPWGTLRADGIVVPLAGATRLPPSFRLPDGRHTLEYSAPPLPTLRCVVTVPAGPGETCPMLTDRQDLPGDAGIAGASNVLDLRATPARLPPDARAALERAIADALEASAPIRTGVATGERYAAPGGIATAAHPLTAALRAQLAPGGASDVSPLPLPPLAPLGMLPTGVDALPLCLDICTDISLEGQLADHWPLDVSVTLSWQYTDPSDGRVIATVPLDFPAAQASGTITGDGARFVLPVLATWDGSRWQVTPADPTSIAGGPCTLALASVAQFYAALPPISGGSGTAYGSEPTTNPADGCVVSYQRLVGDATNPEPQGVFFLRLGLLLAANDQAHALFPALPVVDARDRAIISGHLP